MELKKKTIAALEKRVEMLDKGGVSEAQTRMLCEEILVLTGLLAALNGN